MSMHPQYVVGFGAKLDADNFDHSTLDDAPPEGIVVFEDDDNVFVTLEGHYWAADHEDEVTLEQAPNIHGSTWKEAEKLRNYIAYDLGITKPTMLRTYVGIFWI